MFNKNSIVIGLFTVTTFSFATTYNVVVSQDHNKYTPSEFSKTGNMQCNNISPLTTDIYTNKTFTQLHSDCEEEYIDSVGTISWNPIDDFSTVEIGIHIEDSCKNIKSFDASLQNGNYDINISGNVETVNCEMTIDGGGWMNVANISGTYAPAAPVVTIDDKGVSHTEVLYTDKGSYSDLAYGSASWEWQGMDIEKNVLKTGGQWRQVAASKETCLTLSNTLPQSNYRILERENISKCEWGTTNNTAYCGSQVVVSLPSGHSFEGFGDIESVYSSCHTNNHFTLDYSLYIR